MRRRKNKLGEAGASAGRETVNISDLMVAEVVTTKAKASVASVRELMRDKRINALPVVDGRQHAVGIVTTTDLLEGAEGSASIGDLMTSDVYTIPTYARIHDAARMMRNHHIHHLVVTHEKKVVGILSSFDILELVAQNRFVMRPQQTRSNRAGRRTGGVNGNGTGDAPETEA